MITDKDIRVDVLIKDEQKVSPNGKKMPVGEAYTTIKGYAVKKSAIWPSKTKFGDVYVLSDADDGQRFYLQPGTARNGSPFFKCYGGYDSEGNRLSGFVYNKLAIPLTGFRLPVKFKNKYKEEVEVYPMDTYKQYEGNKVFNYEDETVDLDPADLQKLEEELFPEYKEVKAFIQEQQASREAS